MNLQKALQWLKGNPLPWKLRKRLYERASTHLANDVTLERVLTRFGAGLLRRRKRRAAAAIDAVTQGVRNGQTLAAAMDSSLTNLERTVLDAGDRAGKLPEAMKLVIEVRELVDRIFWKLILGFAPALVYVYALYKVLGFIGADVVPEFAGILPAEKWTGWARVLYLMGVFAQSAAMPLATYGLLTYALWCAWALPNWAGRGRAFFDRWVFPFPLYREIAGFSRLLSFLALQRAGIPEVESLAAQVRTASPWLASRLLAISSGTRNGFDLATSMMRTGHDFPSVDLIDEIGEYMGKADSSEKLANVARENAAYVERKVLAIGGGMALTLSLLVYAAMFVMQFGSNALSSALTSSMRQM